MTRTDLIEGWLSREAMEIIRAITEHVFDTQSGTHIFMRQKAEELEEFLAGLKGDKDEIH